MAWIPRTSGIWAFRFLSIPVWRVTEADGQPTQAPCIRIWTTLSGVNPTNSMSPPSAWTAGRMSSMTLAIRSGSVPVCPPASSMPGSGLGIRGEAGGVVGCRRVKRDSDGGGMSIVERFGEAGRMARRGGLLPKLAAMNYPLCRVLGSVAVLVGMSAVAPWGCSEHPKGVTGEPTVDARNKDLQANQRIIALEALWAEAGKDPERLPAAREGSKDTLWKGSAPQILRQRALALLLTDTSPEGMADTRKFMRLRLPTEGQWPVVVDFCKAMETRAADAAWQDQTASLVRSYARKVPVPPDEDRPERSALLALHPGKDLTAIVFDVFVRPVENGAPKIPDDSAEKSRQAAWDLLGRIDPDGSRRTVLAAAEPSGDPSIKEINKCARDLGVVPITGSELAWLHGLTDEKDKRNSAWWSAAMQAVGALRADQKTGLQLRHIEPLRWASANHSEWAAASHDQLLAELNTRLTGRRIWLKTEGLGQTEEKSKETLKDWAAKMVWGDLLSLIVLDEAIHRPGVIAEMFKQAAQDQADTTTEYGGVLWAAEQGGAETEKNGKFAVRAYQPRTTQRKDDRTFIAPEEMFTDSARSLGHYHFHVQTPNNRDYAGPGRGDLEYAANHGRNCVVFTSVREGAMDADYYVRGGIVIDLGEIVVGK
jgi:hypothetical protein